MASAYPSSVLLIRFLNGQRFLLVIKVQLPDHVQSSAYPISHVACANSASQFHIPLEKNILGYGWVGCRNQYYSCMIVTDYQQTLSYSNICSPSGFKTRTLWFQVHVIHHSATGLWSIFTPLSSMVQLIVTWIWIENSALFVFHSSRTSLVMGWLVIIIIDRKTAAQFFPSLRIKNVYRSLSTSVYFAIHLKLTCE